MGEQPLAVVVPNGGHFPWVEVPGCVRAAADQWPALRV
jgi:hypothetical protein